MKGVRIGVGDIGPGRVLTKLMDAHLVTKLAVALDIVQSVCGVMAPALGGVLLQARCAHARHAS